MHFKPPHCKRLQGAADASRRVRRRTFVLQVPDNKADAVPCERLQNICHSTEYNRVMLEEIKAPVIAWHTLAYEEVHPKTIKNFYSVIKYLLGFGHYEPVGFQFQLNGMKKMTC